MSKIFSYIIALVCVLALTLVSCSDNDSTFAPKIGAEAFSFTPIAGGAIMHYTVPDDDDISGITVRYKDYSGKDCLVSGSALSDSLNIVGFNEARNDVPVQVRLVKRNGEESEPINSSFSTLDSGPIGFFKNLEVSSGWNGFTLSYDNPKGATGLAHIFYLGINPYTNETDTILLSTINIKPGKETMKFKVQQENDVNTIVVRTEDVRGYRVKQEIFPNIQSFSIALIPPSDYSFYWKTSMEDKKGMVGSEYLFDGDTKGEGYLDDNNMNHYRMAVAGPNAIGDPMYIDLKKNRIVSVVRFYAPIQIKDRFFALIIPGMPATTLQKVLDGNIACKLPCDVDVYGAKDDSGNGSDWESKQWELIGSYQQSDKIAPTLRWCRNCWGNSELAYEEQPSTKEEVDKTDPIYMQVEMPFENQADGYRYIKIVVNKTFITSERSYGGDNISNYVVLQELELYTKK